MPCDLVRHGTLKGQLGRATMRGILPVEDTLTREEAEFYLRVRAAATSKARTIFTQQCIEYRARSHVVSDEQADALKNVFT